MSLNDLVTIQEAAEYCKVSKRTIRNWISDGFITGYRLPGAHLVRVDLREIERKVTIIPAVTR